MNKILEKVAITASPALNQMKKHSPEILLAVGIISFGACVFTACRATLKIQPIIKKTKIKINNIKSIKEMDETYTKEIIKKDTTKVYAVATVDMFKEYAPAVAFGLVSISCILGSNHILSERNAALSAAYTSLSAVFNDYRKRVKETYGDDADYKMSIDQKSDSKSEKTEDEESEMVKLSKDDTRVFFDETNPYWKKESMYNFYFLQDQQAHMNDLLRLRGILFLNEVYYALGIQDDECSGKIKKTRAGQIIGWVYDKDNPDLENVVDFGIRDYNNPYERSFLLTFNTDGPVWSYLK